MGHSSKEGPRQRELKAARLTWDTALRRAQDRGNWPDHVQTLHVTLGYEAEK